MVLLSREFIAVPDDKKKQIVFKWPDVRIRKFTRAIVDADEMALFVNTGQVVGTMGPGRHQIDAQELPFLGMFIDAATGGNAYRSELYFVGTREYPGFAFGGRIDDVQDPQTGMIVTLRVFGDYSLQVKDPAALITNLVGTVDVTNNETVAGWVSDQLLKVMRTEVTRQIVRNGWPILGLSAYTPDIEKAIIEAGNNQLVTYGVALVRMGNFDVNLSEQDEAQLKNLAKDTAVQPPRRRFQPVRGGRNGPRRRSRHGQGRRQRLGGLPGRRARARGPAWWRSGWAAPRPGPTPRTWFCGWRRRLCRRRRPRRQRPRRLRHLPSPAPAAKVPRQRDEVLRVVRYSDAASCWALQRLRLRQRCRGTVLRPMRPTGRPSAGPLPLLRCRGWAGHTLLRVLRDSHRTRRHGGPSTSCRSSRRGWGPALIAAPEEVPPFSTVVAR